MSLIPTFSIGVWNAWILITPYLLYNFGLTSFIIGKKSAFWASPSYNRLLKICLFIGMLLMCILWIYSILLPLSLDTTWFYVGLFIYLLGWILLILAMLAVVTTPVDKPNTTGIYRFSRHPWYLGMFFIYIGTGVASASWIYLLITFLLLAIYNSAFLSPEERLCCERFAGAYREYMNRTPRWIGIPKSR